jgi:hypothetical protein
VVFEKATTQQTRVQYPKKLDIYTLFSSRYGYSVLFCTVRKMTIVKYDDGSYSEQGLVVS